MKIQALSSLKDLDDLVNTVLNGKNCFLHKEHRWILPLLGWSQYKNLLPTPCTIVTFDRHNDCMCPRAESINHLRILRDKGVQVQDLIDLCRETDDFDYTLATGNDDWLIAAMELGMIENAIIFGIYPRDHECEDSTYTDHLEQKHFIERPLFFPGKLLDRDLGDYCHEDKYQKLRNILGWKRKDGFQEEKIFMLDFDLDCFVIEYKDYYVPWPDEIFEEEFCKQSYKMLGWSGQTFMKELIKHAGIITIAKEPDHCGSDEKANYVLMKLIKYFFDEGLQQLFP